MQNLLLYAIAVYLLLIAVTYFLIFQRVLGLALQYPSYELKSADQVPDNLKLLLQQPIEELGSLGFQFCGYVQSQSAMSVGSFKGWDVLLYHKESKAYANVEVRFPIESTNPFSVEFLSFFKDRTLLLTMNGKRHGLLGEIPNTIVHDPYAAQVADQWQAHQDQLQSVAASRTPCGLAPAAFVKAMEQHFGAQIDQLVKSKQIVPITGTSQFHYTWKAALQLAIKFKRGMGKGNAITKQRTKQAKTNTTIRVEIPVELEVEGFRRQQLIEQGQVKRKLGIWVLLGSLVVSIASFTTFFDPKALVILIGVLFLHELGHFLAMRLFGYQDTSMFFLPFFGAAVTGRKDDASLTEKVWVLLAGPLPGLLLGIGLAIAQGGASYPTWAREGLWMLIGINLFNLLPIYPLDGGKIASLLVFSRYPYMDVLFKIFAVIVLVLMGMGSPITFGIAMIVALTIPAGYRSAKVDAKLRREFPHLSPTDGDSLLSAIFKTLKQSGYGSLAFIQRYGLAKDLLQRHRESHAKWFTRVALSGVYCFSLVGGMVGTLQAITPNWQRLITAQDYKSRAKQEIEAATKALESNPNDEKAYVKRGRMRLVLRDYQGAIVDAEQAIRLNPKSSEGYFLRSSIYYGLGDRKEAEAAQQKGRELTHLQTWQSANEAVRQNPKDLKAYLSRGSARSQLRDYKGAIGDFNQILKLDSKNAEAFIGRAQVRYQLKDYKTAFTDANSAIRFNPQASNAYYLRAEIRRQLGDINGAKVDEQKADTLYQQEEGEQ